MENTIVLPAGTVKIPVKDIPWKIAETVVPEKKATTNYIAAIKKIYTDFPGMPEGYEGSGFVELTDKDWKFLNNACGLAGLKPIRKGKEIIEISLSQWKLYEDALEEAFEDHEKDWKVVSFSNPGLKIAADKHKQFLTDAVKKGDVVVNNGETCIPLQQPIDLFELEAAYMALYEFQKFVDAKFQLQVHVSEKEVGQVTDIHTKTTANDMPPGKIPKNGIGKLAVEAAWKIEKENNGIVATPNAVIARLQQWAKDKKYPDILMGASQQGVYWLTAGQKEYPKEGKEYCFGACQKALYRWRNSYKLADKI